MLKNKPKIGSVLRICTSEKNLLPYNNQWGIVRASHKTRDRTTVNLEIVGKTITIENSEENCTCLRQNSYDAQIIINRINKIEQKVEDKTVEKVILDIITRQPKLSKWQEILLNAIEEKM